MGFRLLLLLSIIILISDCVEPYDFRIKNEQSTLVIESQISNVSYNETKNYPSDGRYFNVKLSVTSDVINIKNDPISYATVMLYDDSGEYWIYTENPVGSGVYYLYEDEFKADVNRAYKLTVNLLDGRIYESSYEKISNQDIPKIGSIGFEEIKKQVYEFAAGEEMIFEKNGINVTLDIPKHQNEEPICYRWTFTPTWVFISPFAFSSQPGYKCWVQNPLYLKDYALLTDNVGGYKKDLFFMETTRNERIYERFSVLITQCAISKEYYNFWEDISKQTQRGGLFDEPPYNLKSNFKCTNCNSHVSGYFAVASEQAKRWYFTKKDLSYNVVNTLRADCSVPYQDPGPECFNCLAYPFGNSVDVKPDWWE